MFLSLQGLLIGLAVVAGAFVVGVVASVVRPQTRKGQVTEPRMQKRQDASVGSHR